MMQWEYKIINTVKPSMLDVLNAYGVDGWELVSVINIANGYQYIFKRRAT